MTEMVWLTAARAWNMPVSRLSADAATRLGLTERPNDWCQVRPCNTAGRQQDGFLAKIASVLEIAPPRVSEGEEAAGDELPQTGRGDRHQGLRGRGEISLQHGAGQHGRAEGDTQIPCPHSAAEWGEMVSKLVGE